MQICWRSLRGTTDWSRPVRPKLLLMPSLPKCSVRVRSFDRQRMKSSVCWLRVVIWIMLLRPWIDPMKLTKQHPFPSVSTLLSQRQRQRVPQRLP
ncbi:unnamed protein product [Cladocopium goreaui]|uniref:Uncharacterized protein n=1 Tax=Cladocopium goreaui TaxID=2562237 RepID=A0A9P1GJQ5_9DINO|nr:unnamed protein product [Cladocopium goreaui]